MGNFVNSNLIKDEKVIYEASVYQPLHWVSAVVVGLILSIWTMGLGLVIMLVWTYFQLKNIELVVTNKRLITKHGVLSRHTFEQQFSKIESVQIKQGFLGRMLGYGSIIVVGTGGSSDTILNIKNPFEFRNKFLEISA